MNKDIEEIVLSEKQISSLCDEIAGRINEDYKGSTPVLVCILKGSVVFYADLIRRLQCDCRLDFMAASSYGSGTASSGKVKITKELTTDITGRDVLLVEDILDTGNTLSYIKEYLSSFSPASVRICTLFDKPSRRLKDIEADYKGKTIDDVFIVGYGLDYNEKYRNLPYVGILKPEVYTK